MKIRIALAVVMVFNMVFGKSLFAQSVTNDLAIIEHHDHAPFIIQHHKPEYIFSRSNVLIKYNPLSLVLGGSMFLYQSVVSPQINAQCLYQPSCSHFSVNAIREFGVFKGVFVSADRLMRCNRLASMDVFKLHVDPNTHRVAEEVSRYSLKTKIK